MKLAIQNVVNLLIWSRDQHVVLLQTKKTVRMCDDEKSIRALLMEAVEMFKGS